MNVIAMYDDTESAAQGIQQLMSSSFDAQHVRVVFFDRGGPEPVVIRHWTRFPLGAAVGAFLGALGGGAAVATGIGITPALMASQPLWAGLAAVLGGAAVAGFAGALTGLMFWHKEVALPDLEVAAGGVLVAVPATSDERREMARAALEDSGARLLTA